MALQASIFKKTFHFNFQARTSRGAMKEKVSWFIKVWDSVAPEVVGIGEAGPLPGLSVDAVPELESVFNTVASRLNGIDKLDAGSLLILNEIIPAGFPSIRFACEMALLDLHHGGRKVIFENDFIHGAPLPINGLIWMGGLDFMMSQVNEKIAKGFRCIKMKVGGLDFDRECEVLEYLRKRYYKENLTLRVDANGAFKASEAMTRLQTLAKLNIHSIEQPIKPGLAEMAELCRTSPVPIALDEELIGKESREEKEQLLNRLLPKYIILKPTLHGGLKGCREWIEIAEAAGIGWWITSALESNIGLNAICQFTASYPVTMPQGLGTGMLYEDNIPSPLTVKEGTIYWDAREGWGK